MSDNRPLESNLHNAKYNSLVAAINYEYCKLHKYDFIYYRPYLHDAKNLTLLTCINPITKRLRHASWSKLISTKLALQLGYDYIVYIDSDCIFKDFATSIEDFITPYTGKDILFLKNTPWGDNLPCAGFYICKVNEYVAQFLRDWYNVNIPGRDEQHAWEQDALWRIFNKYNIHIIDSLMFLEHPNQFLRHICHCEDSNRANYFSSFLKSKAIDYEKNINDINVIAHDTANM